MGSASTASASPEKDALTTSAILETTTSRSASEMRRSWNTRSISLRHRRTNASGVSTLSTVERSTPSYTRLRSRRLKMYTKRDGVGGSFSMTWLYTSSIIGVRLFAALWMSTLSLSAWCLTICS